MLIFKLLPSLSFFTPFSPNDIPAHSTPSPPPPNFCFIYVCSPATSILTHPYPLHVIVSLCSSLPIPPAPPPPFPLFWSNYGYPPAINTFSQLFYIIYHCFTILQSSA